MSAWLKVCPLEEIPPLGARVVKTARGDVAVFRNAQDEVFAVDDRCPHKGGPLSQGIVAGKRVTCPLHGMHVALDSGEAVAPDKGCTHRYAARVDNGTVLIQLD